MPSRKKNVKPPPKFSFVTLAFEAKDKRWLKIHSGAPRSHAAYWGGPAKYQRQGEQQIVVSTNPVDTKATTSLPETASNSSHDLEPDKLQHFSFGTL
jgi:hypothetical protein